MSNPLFKPQQGTLHNYAHGLTAFEFATQPALNIVLFVGGLTNGLLDVPYLESLALAVSSIPHESEEDWSLVQVLLTSSYSGWGTSSLAKDTEELRKAVGYFRSKVGGSRQKIVLMGHSTGCQDAMEYITREWHKPGFSDEHKIEGAILQAPVSDCENLAQTLGAGEIDDLISEIERDFILTGKVDDILPEKFRKLCWGYPITAYRFKSLMKPREDDDYFSSFLTQEDFLESFAKINCPLLVLYGSKDEFVPSHVDRQELINSWKRAAPSKLWSPFSKVLTGATHDVGPDSDEGTQQDLIDTVISFVKSTC